MTKHELYINDKLVDIDKDVNIYPIYQSPVFTDLQAIVSNRSNNISLPITDNNAKSIEMYHLADKHELISEPNTFPRRWHSVKYYRNGIAICEDAKGFITEIENYRINFTFYWGNIENFQQLFDKKLTELKFRNTINWYNGSSFTTNPEANYGFFKLNFGLGMTDMETQHPSVSTNFIIEKIAEDNNIQINNIIDNEPITSNLILPCLTKYSADWANSNSVYRCSHNAIERGCLVPNMNTVYSDDLTLWDKSNDRFDLTKHTCAIVTITKFCVWYNNLSYGNSIYISAGDHKIDPISIVGDKDPNLSDKILVTFPDVTFDVDCTQNGTFRIQLTDNIDNGIRNLVNDGKDIIVTVTPYAKEVVFGRNNISIFPIAPNLPNITQADFLRSILQLNGLFAYSKTPNTIDLLSIDDIMNNIPNSSDWTDKLVNTSNNLGAPENIEFRLTGFAQNNIFKYDNDEDITDDLSYYLTVNDTTIDREKKAVELAFSQTRSYIDTNLTYAKIPVYSDGHKYNDDITPRILKPIKRDGIGVGVFNDMGWKTILKHKYKGYQNVIKNPRILKVQCVLNDIDFSNIDFSRPIFFQQFGNYYAILKIQSAANGICKCEFLELKES